MSVERPAPRWTTFESADGCYRYQLARQISSRTALHAGMLNIIMLNPSTTTEQHNDPTIRRCVGYARAWGYGTLVVTNLFALRSTAPGRLKLAVDPIGPDNNWHIHQVAREANLLLAAWGVGGGYRGRDRSVLRIVSCFDVPLKCLGRTKGGYPFHPLYRRASLQPVPFGVW